MELISCRWRLISSFNLWRIEQYYWIQYCLVSYYQTVPFKLLHGTISLNSTVFLIWEILYIGNSKRESFRLPLRLLSSKQTCNISVLAFSSQVHCWVSLQLYQQVVLSNKLPYSIVPMQETRVYKVEVVLTCFWRGIVW